jgi:raffinose/stachyose/melibiose transport system permease protein
MVLNSFKGNDEIAIKPLAMPSKWNFGVFPYVWTRLKLTQPVLNSLIITISVVSLTLIFSSMAAYSISHLHFWGQNLVLSFCLGCQVVSGQVLLVPLYNLMLDLKIINTLYGLVIVMLAFGLPFNTYLFYFFFRGIPKEIFESTKIDGCGDLRYYLKILIPLSTPIIASVGIFSAMGAWNEYLFALTFIRTAKKWPIQPVIKSLGTGYSPEYGALFATLTIAVVPILLLYIFLQKYFVRGLIAGSVKG